MSDESLPTVSVWAKVTGASYALVGNIAAFDSLDFEPRFLEAGTWEMSLPYDQAALSILTDRLYTIDWRGHRTTWALDTWNPSSDEKGNVTLTVGGPSAVSMLGWDLAWPDPLVGVNAQPDPPTKVTGPAETVVRTLINQNWVTRRGGALTVPASLGRGTTISARARFDNLLELAAKKAKAGGIGFDVNLVNTSSTRATLTLQFFVPVDRSQRVRLSEQVGTLGSWSQTNSAPTVTKALVAGVGAGTGTSYSAGRYTVYSTPESDAAATAWGGHRVGYVAGPSSYDDSDLVQAGKEALEEGIGEVNASLSGTDSEGLQAFTHYNVGDKVTGQLETGLDVVDVITSIKVSVGDSFPEITATFGDPAADDPLVSMAELTRANVRRLRQLEQRS